MVEVKVLTTGAGVSCSLWIKEAEAAYQAALLAIAHATGSLPNVTSLCRQLNGTASAAVPSAMHRGLLEASPTTTLEIVHLLNVRGSLSTAQAVVANTASAIESGMFATAVQKRLGGSTAWKPLPTPHPSCIVDVTCPPSPQPPAWNAMVVADPHVYDFLGKKSEYRGTAGGTMSILLAGKGAAAMSLTAKLAAFVPRPGSTIMTSVAFKAAGATVVFTQSRTQPGGAYKLAARITAANGTSVSIAAGTTGPARLPGLVGILGGTTQGYLNAIVAVTSALPSPVRGVLGPSYNAQAMRVKALSTNTAVVASLGAFVDN
eukprot:scaffold15.g4334.t1